MQVQGAVESADAFAGAVRRSADAAGRRPRPALDRLGLSRESCALPAARGRLPAEGSCRRGIRAGCDVSRLGEGSAGAVCEVKVGSGAGRSQPRTVLAILSAPGHGRVWSARRPHLSGRRRPRTTQQPERGAPCGRGGGVENTTPPPPIIRDVEIRSHNALVNVPRARNVLRPGTATALPKSPASACPSGGHPVTLCGESVLAT
ncbi:hypothetical protein JOF55_001244 [Haloactinomyces albus]|uniref:Uncharacterized protein n=1 Tax=Haloactinomyces albus TaxID=1352928 RepID=A0AAE4CNV5_9ACTN|nr:hypothetical protein [Haloactinomyces albus]